MITLGKMVFKGVNWVHNTKIRSYGLKRSKLCTQLGHMVLKRVNWVHNTKIKSHGSEMSKLRTQ